MSEADSYWASLAEKVIGIVLIIISGLMIYYTATSTDTLGEVSWIFGVLGAIVLIVGILLLLVRPQE
jgi:hypothetical protein